MKTEGCDKKLIIITCKFYFPFHQENPFRRAMNRQITSQPPASPSSSSSESTPTNNNVQETNSIQSMPEMPHQTGKFINFKI